LNERKVEAVLFHFDFVRFFNQKKITGWATAYSKDLVYYLVVFLSVLNKTLNAYLMVMNDNGTVKAITHFDLNSLSTTACYTYLLRVSEEQICIYASSKKRNSLFVAKNTCVV